MNAQTRERNELMAYGLCESLSGSEHFFIEYPALSSLVRLRDKRREGEQADGHVRGDCEFES
jgi:hypothetical protein